MKHPRLVIGVAGIALLGVLTVLALTAPRCTHLDRATPQPTTLTPELTRTTQLMTDETEVRKLAERYLQAVNEHDDATIALLNCAKAAPGLIQIAADGRPVTLTGLTRNPRHDWYVANLTIGGMPGGSVLIVWRDGVWCVRD